MHGGGGEYGTYGCIMQVKLKGIFILFFFFCAGFNTALSAALRFHCFGGCWDRTQDCVAALSLTARRSNHSARSHRHSARSHPGMHVGYMLERVRKQVGRERGGKRG